uniref:Uncharacterized protein n=1 Tax=Romanomermis culicivorax TaxID=13658 RepID=A0A915J2E1_ROMCU
MSDPQSSIAYLFKAVENGRIDVLRSILSELEAKSKSSFVNIVDKTFVYDDGNLMHFATQVIEILRFLIKNGSLKACGRRLFLGSGSLIPQNVGL